MANPRRPQSFEGADWAATHTSTFIHNTSHACRGQVGMVISMGITTPKHVVGTNPLHNASPTAGFDPSAVSPRVGRRPKKAVQRMKHCESNL
jgi:hypothetical protein